MLKCRFFLPAIVGLGILAMNPPEAGAQKGGRGGGAPAGGNRGGAHPGGAHPGGARPGAPHGGSGHYRYGGGFYGGIYPGFYDPFWYGYGSPRYYNYNYGYPPNYSAYPPSTYDYADPLVPVQPRDQTAQIEVRLPRPDAKVWVDGNLMSSGSGTLRSFTSPELEPGYSYSYRITAAWMDDGKEVRVERTVPVSPGRVSLADFTRVDTTPRMPPSKD